MPPTAQPLEVVLAPDCAEGLRALFDGELRLRRAFVPGHHELRPRERCVLAVVHPNGRRFSVTAEAVHVQKDGPGAGVGLELVGLDGKQLAALETFVRGSPAETSATISIPEDQSGPRSIVDRVRKLGARDRERIARQGQLAERIVLERVFGSSVWEGLLQNPMLTVPEVAQISRKGTLPQPLVEVIVANGAWLASAEVRRALMSNPRVSGLRLDRVLRATPKAELKQIATMSPYRIQVRDAAKKLLGE